MVSVSAGINVVMVRVPVVQVVIYIDRRTNQGVGGVIYAYRRTGVVDCRVRFVVVVVVGAGGVSIVE